MGVPAKFKELAQQIEHHQEETKRMKQAEKEKKTKGQKRKREDEEDDDGEDSDDSERIEMNTNDISIASRWSILTLHSHKSNTIIGERFRLINNNVVCISTLSYESGVRWHNSGDYFATFRPERER